MVDFACVALDFAAGVPECSSEWARRKRISRSYSWRRLAIYWQVFIG
ncbi:hypothetical protein ABTY96_44190 [Streptomyces sp. NPDC096057]